MADIFSEVEEEVRKERWEQLWKSYGTYIIMAASAVVVSVAGWQAWERYTQAQRESASLEFNAAMRVAETGNVPQAEADLLAFSGAAPDGYAKLSEFQLAKTQIFQGRQDAAIASLQRLIEDPDPLLNAPARVQLAWLLADTAPRGEVEAVIAPLQGGQSPWRFAAAEIAAYLEFRVGHWGEATAAYQALAVDPGVSEGTTQRAGAVAQFLRANAPAPTNAAEMGETDISGDEAATPAATTEPSDQEAPQ